VNRWHRIQDLFEQAADLIDSERVEFLRQETGDDPQLQFEVDSLLKADQLVPELWDESAAAWISRQLPEPDAEALVGKRVGAYEIKELVASGGTSDVYRATRYLQDSEQQVILKVLRYGLYHDGLLARFQKEQDTLAALRHPFVVTLLDTGSLSDRRPFLALEFIDGVPVTQWCEESQAGVRERLEVFRKILSAVQHAHQNLVVHRDLKPSNVLVTREGVPKLLDFGIAELLLEEPEPAQEGGAGDRQRLTWAYASPEQLRGEPAKTRSDVYSLGVLLFEMLTSRAVFDFDRLTAPDQVPARPSEVVPSPGLRRALSGDLDSILATALAPDSLDRYASAEQFSEDIRRHLEGLPVQVREPTLAYRTAKFLRRKPWLVAATLLALLAVAAGWTGSELSRQHAQANARRGWGAHAQAKLSSHYLAEVLTGVTASASAWLPVVDSHAAEIPDRFGDCPETEGLASLAFAQLYAEHGLVERSLPLLARASQLVESGDLSKREGERVAELLASLPSRDRD
jgi:serine/threonine protein kinase